MVGTLFLAANHAWTVRLVVVTVLKIEHCDSARGVNSLKVFLDGGVTLGSGVHNKKNNGLYI